MKKVLYVLIGFVIGIVFSVTATILYNAKDVEYSGIIPEATNVEDALESLYSGYKEKNNLIAEKNAIITSQSNTLLEKNTIINQKKYMTKVASNLNIHNGSYTVNLSSAITDCTKYKTSDFMYVFASFTEAGPSGSAGATTPTIYKSYDSSTCVFTYGRSSVSGATPYIYVDLYLIY